MFKATILFSAEGKTEDEVIGKLLFEMSEEIRNEGQNIKVKEIEGYNE